MKYTGNYNLKKPEGSDIVNIEDLNDNADIIDQALKAHDDALATKETPAGAQAKAEAALNSAKQYTDQEVAEVSQALAAHQAENVSQKEVHGLRIEEGVWVPKLVGSITAGEHTYSKQVGKYIREGNKVTIWFDIEVSALDSNANGNARVVGIPFPTNSKNPGALTWTNISMPTEFIGMTGVVLYEAVQLYNVGDAQPISAVNINSFKNNSSITGTVVYYIDLGGY